MDSMLVKENNFDQFLNVSAVPQDDRVAAFIAESKNNRSRCYEMSEKMTEMVSTDSEMFKEYLDIQSRFDRYTANNVLLIMAQNPEAKKLGDYGYWRDQGAFVKRQERNNPVLIMEPGKEYERDDGSIGTYYNAKKLYDITQTSFKDKLQTQEEVITDSQLVRAVVNNPPVAIVAAEPDQMPEGKGAIFEPEENCIYVKKGMNAQNIFRSLTMELALAARAQENENYNREENSFYAYCASYMLCKKYEVDTKGFDFTQVPQLFTGMEPQEIRSELSKVREAAVGISSRMEKVLEQDRNQNSKQQSQTQHNREEAR